MERSTSRIELLAEAARWERLAKAVEEAEEAEETKDPPAIDPSGPRLKDRRD